jgi:hypothetical protein
MKLTAISLSLLLLVCSCNSSKEITNDHPAKEPSTVTVSLLIETRYNQCSLNDIISVCSQVKPFRSYSVNYISTEKMELRLVYGQISTGQKEELYNQINSLGARILYSSGL